MELFEENPKAETLSEVVAYCRWRQRHRLDRLRLLNSRVAYWLISAPSSRPLWKGFDPLEVIFAWEEEEEERKKAHRPHFLVPAQRPRPGIPAIACRG